MQAAVKTTHAGRKCINTSINLSNVTAVFGNRWQSHLYYLLISPIGSAGTERVILKHCVCGQGHLSRMHARECCHWNVHLHLNGLSYKRKTYIDGAPKPQVGSNRPKSSPPPLFSAFSWETRLVSHMWNTHGPHTTNPHSDSSYSNIFFRLPALSSFLNTRI